MEHPNSASHNERGERPVARRRLIVEVGPKEDEGETKCELLCVPLVAVAVDNLLRAVPLAESIAAAILNERESASERQRGQVTTRMYYRLLYCM